MRTVQLQRNEVELWADARPGQPVVLFLHGLAGHRGEWAQVIARLDESVGVIALDQRGHGVSYSGRSVPVDRVSYVGDAIAVVEAFVGRGPVVAVGQSMGGIVALLLAHERPDLVSSVVLIEVGMEAMEDSETAALDRWLRSWPPAFADAAEARDFFGTDARSTSAWVEGLQETGGGLVARFDRSQMLDTMRSVAGRDRWSEWVDIESPLTLVRASSSMVADSDVERMLRTQPGSELIDVDDSGHNVHLDQPEAVADIVMRVVKRQTHRS